MSDRNIINQLHELRTVRRAPALWREQTRDHLLSLAARSPQRSFSFGEAVRLRLGTVRLAFAPLPLLPVTVAVLALLFGSAPLAHALQVSAPGSFFYPMKRSVERLELAFRATPESQGLYHLELAARRLDEAATLTPTSLVTQASLLRDYNVDLGFAEASLQASSPAAALALRYDEAAERLSRSLASLYPLASAQATYGAAVALTDKLSSQAVALLVAAHQNGGNGVLPAAVAVRLESQITKVEAKLDGVDTKLRAFPESKPPPRVVLEARQAFVSVTVATLEAKKSLTEARTFLKKKEFSLALQKVQESEDITLKSEAAVDKAEQPSPPPAPGKVEGAANDNGPGAPSSAPEPTAGPAAPQPDPGTASTNQPVLK